MPTSKAIDALNPPSEWLGSYSPEAREGYRALRAELSKNGPLDATTCEIINVVCLALLGYEPSFRIHAKRLADSGVPKRTVQHAIVSTLGATMVLYQVARAMMWLEEIYETQPSSTSRLD